MAGSERIRQTARKVRDRVLRATPEERAALSLWDGTPPDGQICEGQAGPTYSLYLPQAGKRSGAGIVVFPGGGYCAHAEHEAGPVGRWLRSAGIAAMVVRYRLAPHYRHPAMLNDARRAISIMREHAREWGIQRVGVLGFSAGGHLAGMSMLLTEGALSSERPDFGVLIYPVVCMIGPFAHPWCRTALLGTEGETAEAEAVSLERHVDSSSPPVFLVHGADDEVIDVRNSLELATAYRHAGRPCEVHVFSRGPHGFGLGERGQPNSAWPVLCAAWVRALD